MIIDYLESYNISVEETNNRVTFSSQYDFSYAVNKLGLRVNQDNVINIPVAKHVRLTVALQPSKQGKFFKIKARKYIAVFEGQEDKFDNLDDAIAFVNDAQVIEDIEEL